LYKDLHSKRGVTIMPLPGQVQAAPDGVQGFDANTKLTAATAAGLKNAGFVFAIRYLMRKSTPTPGDLDAAEAALILEAGLGLMAVQHVASEGWEPTVAKGKSYGENALAHARAVGFPAGVNIWLDLEGVNHSTSAETVIQYCNAWFDEVAAGGYVPGIYVGANAILSGDQLYWRLRTKHYWKSGSTVPDIPQRGYCMVQRIVANDAVAGVRIDRNVTRTDSFGNAAQWLVGSGAESGDHVPEVLPVPIEAAAVAAQPPSEGGALSIETKLPLPSPGLSHYYTEDRLYGTSLTIEALTEIGRIWSLRRAAPTVGIGDISQRGGGQISGHASHRKGVDVDIRPMRSDGTEGATTWQDPLYSGELTQELVDLFYGNGVLAIKLIFFNDPLIVGRTNWPNHDNHLHVRFYLPGEQSPLPLLASGAKGAPVRELQRRVNFWIARNGGAVAPVGVDGDFGTTTFQAVRAIQTAVGLNADGRADDATWRRLPVA
jgi:hypothetical protein